MSEEPYAAASRGRCPYCQVTVRFDNPKRIEYRYSSATTSGVSYHPTYLQTEGGGVKIHVYSSQCPNCLEPIVSAEIKFDDKVEKRLLIPTNVIRIIPPEVPSPIQEDFLEAVAVLAISEKASAALSRRCLQNLLTDIGAKGKDLSEQIDHILPTLPKRLAENLDAIRKIGNFAVHPTKYISTGLIADVEPEEASWNLDVLEDLFEYYYVQPKRAQKKREELNKKLATMGKAPIKKP